MILLSFLQLEAVEDDNVFKKQKKHKKHKKKKSLEELEFPEPVREVLPEEKIYNMNLNIVRADDKPEPLKPLKKLFKSSESTGLKPVVEEVDDSGTDNMLTPVTPQVPRKRSFVGEEDAEEEVYHETHYVTPRSHASMKWSPNRSQVSKDTLDEDDVEDVKKIAKITRHISREFKRYVSSDSDEAASAGRFSQLKKKKKKKKSSKVTSDSD